MSLVESHSEEVEGGDETVPSGKKMCVEKSLLLTGTIF